MSTQGHLANLPIENLRLIVEYIVFSNSKDSRPLSKGSVEYIENNEKWPATSQNSPESRLIYYHHLKPLSELCQNLRRQMHFLVFQQLDIKPIVLPQTSYDTCPTVTYQHNTFCFKTVSFSVTEHLNEKLYALTHLSISTKSAGFSKSPLPGYVHVLTALPQIIDQKVTPNLNYLKLNIHAERINTKYNYFWDKFKYNFNKYLFRPPESHQIQLHLCIYDSVNVGIFGSSVFRYMKFLTIYTGGSYPSMIDSLVSVFPDLREVTIETHNEKQSSLWRPANLTLPGQRPKVAPIFILKNEYTFEESFNIRPELLVFQEFNISAFTDFSSIKSLYMQTGVSSKLLLKYTECFPSLRNFGTYSQTQKDITDVINFLTSSCMRNKIERIHIRHASLLNTPLMSLMGPVVQKLPRLVAAHFYEQSNASTARGNVLENVQPYICNHPSLVALTVPVHLNPQSLSYDGVVNFIRDMSQPGRIRPNGSEQEQSPPSKFVLRLGAPHQSFMPSSPNEFFKSGSSRIPFLFRLEQTVVSPYDILGPSMQLSESSCIDMTKDKNSSFLVSLLTINTPSVLSNSTI